MYTKENLPENVLGLPENIQHVWLTSYSVAYEQYEDVELAEKIAWVAVKKKFAQKEDGQWVESESENNQADKEIETLLQNKVWSTKYINDLPDAAFAVILPGGEKDEEGKTKPRSLRYFPHHTKDVKNPNEHSTVDLPHLRNALARLPQAKIPEKYRNEAREHLIRHAKALGVGNYAEEEAKAKASKYIDRLIEQTILFKSSAELLQNSEDDVIRELRENKRIAVISTMSGIGNTQTIVYKGRRYYPYIPKEFILENYQAFNNVKSYLGHMTKEEQENGERDISRWVATLTDPEVVELPNGELGIKNWLNIHDSELLNRMMSKTFRDGVGLSHEMTTHTIPEQLDGKDVMRAVGLVKLHSVDLVTEPNFACGVYMVAKKTNNEEDLYHIITIEGIKKYRQDIVDEIIAEVRNSEEIAKLNSELVNAKLELALSKSDLPDAAKERIKTEVLKNANSADFDKLLSDAIAREKEYISKIRQDGKPKLTSGSRDEEENKIKNEMFKKFGYKIQ